MVEKKTIEVVKQALENSKKRNFKESIELAINLKDIDLSDPKNRIDDEIILPKGRGKNIKVAVFGSGELAVKAKKVADLVIKPEEIDKIASDHKKAKQLVDDYNFFIAEAPLMPIIGKKLGVVLGPRGKMPKPVPPTIDISPMVKNLRNTVRIRTGDKKTFHMLVGTKDMPIENIAENIDIVMKRIISRLERGKQNILSVYVKTTMGPVVKLI